MRTGLHLPMSEVSFMALQEWNPLHEPIFLEVGEGIFCCLLKIPSVPRDVAYSMVPFTNANLDKMVPIRREQHAAGRYCLNKVIQKAEIDCQGISQTFPLMAKTNFGDFPASISHCETLAVAVLSCHHYQIGVDIESKNRIIPISILDQFCTLDEIDELSTDSSTNNRLNLWMIKEAVSKATGDGMSVAKAIVIDNEFAQYNSSEFQLIRFEFEGHLIVIAVPYSDSSMDK